MNLHDDYLPILLKEEKLGRLEESQPFSPPLGSPRRTRSKNRRNVRNVFDAARASSEDVLKLRLSITSNQHLVISKTSIFGPQAPPNCS
jgi:hypothetical protein